MRKFNWSFFDIYKGFKMHYFKKTVKLKCEMKMILHKIILLIKGIQIVDFFV